MVLNIYRIEVYEQSCPKVSPLYMRPSEGLSLVSKLILWFCLDHSNRHSCSPPNIDLTSSTLIHSRVESPIELGAARSRITRSLAPLLRDLAGRQVLGISATCGRYSTSRAGYRETYTRNASSERNNVRPCFNGCARVHEGP